MKAKGKRALLRSTVKDVEKRAFGDSLIGEWLCGICGYTIFPNPLRKAQDKFKWGLGVSTSGYVTPLCPKCGILLTYDEAE